MDLTTNGIATDDSKAAGYWARYEHLKYNDVMKNVLIEELISRYQGLQAKHDAYVQQRSEDEESIKRYRAREKHLTASVDQLQRIMNREPFILVLIDGDGMIFNDTLLREGENGGKRAAAALHNAVSQWTVANVVECPANVRIVVRIYANLKGLADVCHKIGIVSSPQLVREFTSGLTRGRPLFDFVDVGYGEDRADGKLVELFKLSVYDYHCRQIIFGCAHDNGYARLLEQYISDEEVIPRVTMLEGIPFEKELAVLPYQKQKFPGLFRESKIVSTAVSRLGDIRRDPHILSGASGTFTPRTPTPISTSEGSLPQLDGVPISTKPAHLRSDSITSSANSSDHGVKTWAGAAKVAASLPFTDLAHQTPQPQEAASAIKRNRKGQRLDDPMEYDREEVQRLKKVKCCNQHYIGFGCCHYIAGKSDKCPHRHDVKLSASHLHSLRVIAKETPCKKGGDCDEAKCIYGHSCPFPTATEGSMRGVGCLNGSACRFPESMHGMDKAPVKMIRVTGLF